VRRTLLTAATLLGTIACGSSGTEPEPEPDIPATLENVAGSYEATHFVGGGFDVLALGGSLDLTLGTDGSLAGNMFIPAAAGGPLDADMAGTFMLSGSSLTFDQAADTFVRDATWTWENNELTGAWSGAGGTALVRLDKQP
jgi:hypothetical protein